MAKLRDHPLMTYRGMRNWPPAWTQGTRGHKKTPEGEVGILTYVHAIRDTSKCYLVIEHTKEHYVGALLFDDRNFASQICAFLQKHCGRSIKEIGDLDVS